MIAMSRHTFSAQMLSTNEKSYLLDRVQANKSKQEKNRGTYTCLVRLKNNYICINRQAWFICLINNFIVYISCASFYVYVHTIFSKVLILKNSCFLFSYLPTSSSILNHIEYNSISFKKSFRLPPFFLGISYLNYFIKSLI